MYSESFIRTHGLKLAIVGRPNVGKSTLFNRLSGKKLAIVDDMPGVTRDRREAFGQLSDIPLMLMDTAGLESQDDSDMMVHMRMHAESALHDADVILLMIDARAGIIPQDETLAQWVRTTGKPSYVVANKCEGHAGSEGIIEAYSLGLGEPVSLSAEHGLGIEDLYRTLISHYTGPLEEIEEEADPDKPYEGPLQLAIVGRPNVGKSTLINKLIGKNRLLTGPEAGITRDAIAIDWEHGGHKVRLYDTAGMRRRARITHKVERLAAADSMNAIQFAQVVVLLIDATMPFEKQDLTIGSKVIEEGRCMVVGLNKWDLVENKQEYLKDLEHKLSNTLPQVKGIPCLPISAKDGKNLDKLMAAVFQMYERWNQRIPTAKLNDWVSYMISHHPPPLVSGRRIKIKYMTQIKTRPPTFVLFCSKSSELPEAYIRYLVNGMREDFDLMGVPIRLVPKSGENPYAK